MEPIKETAANVIASANSGMEKTKATVQEKMERVSAHDPVQKEMATEKKEARIQNAELTKQEALAQNAAARMAANTGNSYSHAADGATGMPTGGHQMSALPGHGTGTPAGAHVTEGITKSHPVGTATGTGRPTAAHNPRVGGGGGGGGYSG